MSGPDLLDKLAVEIEQTRDRLARLEAALAVLNALAGHAPKKEPLFTVTRKARAKTPKPAANGKHVPGLPELRELVLERLKNGPTTTKVMRADFNLNES